MGKGDEKGEKQPFITGILRPGKSEITLKNRKYSIKSGTVDDFDCSYFKTFHATRHSSSAGHGLKSKQDPFKDNASQDSYRLQESRDSLSNDLKGADSRDELKPSCDSGEELLERVSNGQAFKEGKGMDEMGRNASLRSCKSMHECRKQHSSRMRSATVAYDHVIVNLRDRLDDRGTRQSYSTDIDNIMSPLEDKSVVKDFAEVNRSQASGVNSGEMTELNGLSRQLSKEQMEEEECITIIDSKEDGIQYYLHKKTSKQADNALRSFYHKSQADATKNILEEVKLKISKPDRKLKTYNYISYSKLPHRDTFSSRDDTLDNDVFVKNDDLGVWRKVDKSDEKKQHPAVLKHKDSSTRGRILSESDSEHFSHLNTTATNDARSSFKSAREKMKLQKPVNMHYAVEDELNLSECDDEEDKKSCFSSFENEISEQPFNHSYFCDTVCTENVNQIVYKRRVSVLPYNELVKLDLAFLSEMEHYGRHYFCTIDHDVFYKAESSSDNDRFSWMAKNRFRNSLKSSISYRTGYATGSSSSLSVNDELEGRYRQEVKSKRAFQKHQAARMSSCDTTTTHIDKHGHVMEWLEEQQALLEPSQPLTQVRNEVKAIARMKHADSLPGKGKQASLHSSLSSRHPTMHQSSFSTQSFPEPVMEISSDEGPMATQQRAEGFYDVNRILDYVADSNRYINPQLFGFRPTEEQTTGNYNNNNNNLSASATNNAEKGEQRVSKTAFDADRYRLCSKTSKNDFHSHSIDPEKMFSSELKTNGQVARSSQSSQNNEDDHVSDILDALGGVQQAECMPQSDSFQDSFNRILDATQNLNKRLVGLVACAEAGVRREENCYQDVACLEKAESSLAVEQLGEADVQGCRRDELSRQVHLKGGSKKVARPQKATDTFNSQLVMAPICPLRIIESYCARLTMQQEAQVIKKPLVVCEAMNLQVEEKRGETCVGEKAFCEVTRVEAAEKVLRKPRSKPRRVPDKFELFLAGVRVNLVNIVERDPRCENLKETLRRPRSAFRGDVEGTGSSLEVTACENFKSFVVKKRESNQLTYPS